MYNHRRTLAHTPIKYAWVIQLESSTLQFHSWVAEVDYLKCKGIRRKVHDRKLLKPNAYRGWVPCRSSRPPWSIEMTGHTVHRQFLRHLPYGNWLEDILHKNTCIGKYSKLAEREKQKRTLDNIIVCWRARIKLSYTVRNTSIILKAVKFDSRIFTYASNTELR